MMTTVTRSPTPSTTRSGPLTGFGRLFRLNLRLDRLRLVVWVLSFFLLIAGSVAAVAVAYPTPESLQARAALLKNPAAIMMTGPLFAADNYTFGAMVANEMSLYTFLPAAIMGVLFMVRHTRTEEETGRLEVLRALPVGRWAAPAAALALVVLLNVLVGVAVALGLIITDLAIVDSLAFGLATALTGLVFATIAAITAQITDSARAATGIGLGTIALAYAVRGIGDVLNSQGSWLSWFSPFAWAQQTRLFVDLRWWPLMVSVAAILIFTTFAFYLSAHRDLGAGLTSPRPGPARAAHRLLSPVGLALRLESAAFIWWTGGLFFFALGFGLLASELQDMISEIPAVADFIDLDLEDLTRSFGAVMLAMLTIAPIALMVAGVLRLRGEESVGRVAAIIQSGSSRSALLSGWCLVILAWSVIMHIILGFGVGVGMSIADGQLSWMGEMALAALAYLPAIALHGAIAAVILGLSPRLSALGWLPVGWAAFVIFLGEMINLPDWAKALSPLWHTPAVPDADLEVLPLGIMVVLALVLFALALIAYRRRDLAAG
ncbi:ABC transporter permease [Corynebacterium sp. A21]|uniref:ABC transporter permease n=1 Tax=Corynebacterium sp. A21 TaxID=3457318 RepID=UPI003FCF8B18